MADETAALVQHIITKADEELKSVEVRKQIDLEYDVGNLGDLSSNQSEGGF